MYVTESYDDTILREFAKGGDKPGAVVDSHPIQT